MLKPILILLAVLALVGAGFAGGFIMRDYVEVSQGDETEVDNGFDDSIVLPDDPDDYTSSMYLESLIREGKAESLKSVKLEKIDDVSKLVKFPNLRRLRLYDMTGDEDFSVVEELEGLEEITIENSIIKKSV